MTIFHIEKQIAAGSMYGIGSGYSFYTCTQEQTGCGLLHFGPGMEDKSPGPCNGYYCFYILSEGVPRYYILVGYEKTWKVSLSHKVWGFPDRRKDNWNTSQTGEYVAFYVTSQIKREIGFGRIKDKFVSDPILWPDEKLFGKAVWKYRFHFTISYILNDDWNKGAKVPIETMLNTGRSVIHKRVFLSLLKQLNATQYFIETSSPQVNAPSTQVNSRAAMPKCA
jgi:uncharacterized membrane protein